MPKTFTGNNSQRERIDNIELTLVSGKFSIKSKIFEEVEDDSGDFHKIGKVSNFQSNHPEVANAFSKKGVDLVQFRQDLKKIAKHLTKIASVE